MSGVLLSMSVLHDHMQKCTSSLAARFPLGCLTAWSSAGNGALLTVRFRCRGPSSVTTDMQKLCNFESQPERVNHRTPETSQRDHLYIRRYCSRKQSDLEPFIDYEVNPAVLGNRIGNSQALVAHN